MNRRQVEQLRVALVHGDLGRATHGTAVRALADGLETRGHRVSVLGSRSAGRETPPALWRRVPAAVLLERGFTPTLDRMPITAVRLLAGSYDLVHAFSAPDAVAAIWWRRLTGRPVVFTWTETVRREGLADLRLRLTTVQKATEEVDVLMAASESVRDGLLRWFSTEAGVLAVDDISSHEQLYRQIVARA